MYAAHSYSCFLITIDLTLRSRLKAKNLMYIKQLLHILACFLKVLDNDPNRLCPVEKTTTDPPPSEPPSSGTDSSLKYVERCVAFNGVQSLGESSTELMRLNDFLLSANADNINFFKVCNHVPLRVTVTLLYFFLVIGGEPERAPLECCLCCTFIDVCTV